MNILLPNIAYAFSIDDVIDRIVVFIVNPLIGILFAFALLMFLWGVVQFLFHADDETKRTEGKQHIIWGLVGMFIMVSVQGIMDVIQSFVRV